MTKSSNAFGFRRVWVQDGGGKTERGRRSSKKAKSRCREEGGDSRAYLYRTLQAPHVTFTSLLTPGVSTYLSISSSDNLFSYYAVIVSY